MTAFRKDDGGVRGIATGVAFRRLVAESLARQHGKAVETVCSPFQFALSTRAGTVCVGYAMRALTDTNSSLTVTSRDGVGACDQIYPSAMLSKLLEVPQLRGLLQFARFCYCRDHHKRLGRRARGPPRHQARRRRGVQGDPLMPLLFSLGVRNALAEGQSTMALGGTSVGVLQRQRTFLSEHERALLLHNVCCTMFWATLWRRDQASTCIRERPAFGTKQGSEPPTLTTWGGEEGGRLEPRWSQDVGESFIQSFTDRRLEEERRRTVPPSQSEVCHWARQRDAPDHGGSV